jgi:hypothetical protein
MAKKQTLLDELKASAPAVVAGTKTWHSEMEKENPQLIKEIKHVIALWHGKDQIVRNRRPTKTSLADWLRPKCGVGRSALVRFIDEQEPTHVAKG